MEFGNTHPIVFQINEVERHISEQEEKIASLQKKHNIPSDWLKGEFNSINHQFTNDAEKEAYQDIKRYQVDIKVYLNKIGFSRELLRTIAMQTTTCGTNIEDIIDYIIEGHIRLVVSIAKRYRNQETGIVFSDLIFEGINSLIKAIDNFEYQRGYQFRTYATWWIRQGMSRAIANHKSMV